MIYATESKAYKKFVFAISIEEQMKRAVPLPTVLANIVILYKKEFEQFEIQFPELCKRLWMTNQSGCVVECGVGHLFPNTPLVRVRASARIKEMREWMTQILGHLVTEEAHMIPYHEITRLLDGAHMFIHTTASLHPAMDNAIHEARQEFPYPGIDDIVEQMDCRADIVEQMTIIEE